GASRGVGHQIALALAEQGCDLILHSRKPEGTRALAETLQAQGVAVTSFAAELSVPEQVERLIQQVLEQGGVDVLYNNAAVMAAWREAHTTPLADYVESFQVNVFALVRLCDRLLPGMLKRGWGRIVNVTSGIENIRELLPY